jgi:hypothetical protein
MDAVSSDIDDRLIAQRGLSPAILLGGPAPFKARHCIGG